MQHKLVNKKIIVTGASSGIGEKIVRNIAKNGGIPIMLARSSDRLDKIRKQLKTDFNAESFAYKVDLLNNREPESVLNRILSDHEQVHGLINNAGVGMFEYTKDMSLEDMRIMFEVNVFALIRATKYMLPHFLKYGEGHIVNIASQAGKISTPKSSAYSATKHAVLGFTNSLRLEIASTNNIYVTSVNLGPVRTNFFTLADPKGTYQKNVERYMLDPNKVAEKITRYLFVKKREINMPWWMDFGSRMYTLFPYTFEKVLKKQFNKK